VYAITVEDDQTCTLMNINEIIIERERQYMRRDQYMNYEAKNPPLAYVKV
jgi:hypothetical protein